MPGTHKHSRSVSITSEDNTLANTHILQTSSDVVGHTIENCYEVHSNAHTNAGRRNSTIRKASLTATCHGMLFYSVTYISLPSLLSSAILCCIFASALTICHSTCHRHYFTSCRGATDIVKQKQTGKTSVWREKGSSHLKEVCEMRKTYVCREQKIFGWKRKKCSVLKFPTINKMITLKKMECEFTQFRFVTRLQKIRSAGSRYIL